MVFWGELLYPASFADSVLAPQYAVRHLHTLAAIETTTGKKGILPPFSFYQS
jgi:hypothetical protein